MKEIEELPVSLDGWTFDTVVYLVKKHQFEPGAFDYKDVLNASGPQRTIHTASIRRTACSMANTNGGFILFGVKDRQVAATSPEERITGIPLGGDLLKELGEKIEVIQPEIHFDGLPQALSLPNDPSRGVFVVYIPQSQKRPHMVEDKYYRRGEHGAAIAMSHWEVREQMINTEDRMKKITLLRLELAQYKEIVVLMQHGDPQMPTGPLDDRPYRFDTSAFKVLLADVCGLLPSNLLRELLKVPLRASTINNRFERVVQGHKTGDLQNINRELPNLHNLCNNCENELQRIFGALSLR